MASTTMLDPSQREIILAYCPIVQAAGMWHLGQEPLTTFLLATYIAKDPVVWERASAKAVGCVVPEGGNLEVVKGMTDAEKDDMAQRIIKKHNPRRMVPQS